MCLYILLIVFDNLYVVSIFKYVLYVYLFILYIHIVVDIFI